jgi:hypothetical protein
MGGPVMKKRRREEKDLDLVLEYEAESAEARTDVDDPNALRAAGVPREGAKDDLDGADGAADEESPEDRDPEDLDRELGIDRGPDDEVRSSAEILEARDRRRR